MKINKKVVALAVMAALAFFIAAKASADNAARDYLEGLSKTKKELSQIQKDLSASSVVPHIPVDRDETAEEVQAIKDSCAVRLALSDKFDRTMENANLKTSSFGFLSADYKKVQKNAHQDKSRLTPLVQKARSAFASNNQFCSRYIAGTTVNLELEASLEKLKSFSNNNSVTCLNYDCLKDKNTAGIIPVMEQFIANWRSLAETFEKNGCPLEGGEAVCEAFINKNRSIASSYENLLEATRATDIAAMKNSNAEVYRVWLDGYRALDTAAETFDATTKASKDSFAQAIENQQTRNEKTLAGALSDLANLFQN